MNFADTLDNPDWLMENRDALLNILPRDWTRMSGDAALRIGFSLKLVGLDWRNPSDLGAVMGKLDALGLAEHGKLSGTGYFRARADARRTLTLTA